MLALDARPPSMICYARTFSTQRCTVTCRSFGAVASGKGQLQACRLECRLLVGGLAAVLRDDNEKVWGDGVSCDIRGLIHKTLKIECSDASQAGNPKVAASLFGSFSQLGHTK